MKSINKGTHRRWPKRIEEPPQVLVALPCQVLPLLFLGHGKAEMWRREAWWVVGGRYSAGSEYRFFPIR